MIVLCWSSFFAWQEAPWKQQVALNHFRICKPSRVSGIHQALSKCFGDWLIESKNEWTKQTDGYLLSPKLYLCGEVIMPSPFSFFFFFLSCSWKLFHQCKLTEQSHSTSAMEGTAEWTTQGLILLYWFVRNLSLRSGGLRFSGRIDWKCEFKKKGKTRRHQNGPVY